MLACELTHQTLEDVMKALSQEAKRLMSSETLVVSESNEKFSFVDGASSNMSTKRMRAVLRERFFSLAKSKAGNETEFSIIEGDVRKVIPALVTEVHDKVLACNTVTDTLAGLSGYPAGIEEIDGNRYLITQSIQPVEPKEGDCSNIQEMFETACGRDANDPNWEKQLHSIYCLLRAKLIQMRSGGKERGSCPMLCLVGAPNAGKTFVVRAISRLLSQKDSIDPSAENNGWTDGLLTHAVLFFDEASKDTPYQKGSVRAKFAEQFKGLEYTETPTISKRGVTARPLPGVWLTVRAANPDSHMALSQMPVPDENGMADKLILAKFYEAKLPLQGKEGDKDRAKRRKIIDDELPAFAHYLLNIFPKEDMRQEWIVQAGNGDNKRQYRNQCPPFVHPEILELLQNSEDQNSREHALLDFLSVGEAFKDPDKKWLAAEIFVEIKRSSEHPVNSLIKNASVLGKAMRQLAHKNEDLIFIEKGRSDKTFYRIKRPKKKGSRIKSARLMREE